MSNKVKNKPRNSSVGKSPGGKKGAYFDKKMVSEENEDLEVSDPDDITENNSPNSNRNRKTVFSRTDLQHLESHTETLNLKVKRNLKDLKAIDINRRTILHRAALEQNYHLINEILIDFKSFHVEKNSDDPEKLLKEYVNNLDMFGNSPLINACSQQYDYSNEERKKCIKLLLEAGALPKIRNKRTRWSCIYWLCFYGDLDSINVLLGKEGEASSGIGVEQKLSLRNETLTGKGKVKIQVGKPDYMGFYPLDLAGKKVVSDFNSFSALYNF